MCQYACLPAPKTVRSWTECRFLRSMVDARAVRKAVTSSALMRPDEIVSFDYFLAEDNSVCTCGVPKIVKQCQ